MTARISTLIIALAVVFSATGGARAEDFEGENDLLRRISPEERLTYFGLQYSLNRYQKRQFLSLPTREERDEWLDDWWAMHDPTPVTPENERRIEHELRVSLARREFGMKKAPGWDKRGETLIRWGWPSTRTRVPADIGFYRMTPPGELWYYSRLDMTILFHDFNLNGRYIYAIEPQGQSSRETLDKWKAIAEYLQNQPYENVYLIPREDIEALQGFNPDRIDYIASPDARGQLALSSFHDVLERERLIESRNNFYKYMDENPTIYSFELEGESLPLYFDVTAFSGGYGAVRTDVNFEVPSGSLRFERSGGLLSAGVKLDVLVRDIEMNEVARAGGMITASQEGGQVFQGPSFLPGQITLVLEPGYYRVGIEARDVRSGHRGVYTTNVDLPVLHDRLALSSILFASSIREAGDEQKFRRGDLQVVPHPLHAYRIPFPLTFYFEIYGLDTDRDGIAFYSIDYRIVPETKKRRGLTLMDIEAVIASGFETSGFGSTQTQRIEIATDNLWEGNFNLIVTVMDRRTRETVERAAPFSVLD